MVRRSPTGTVPRILTCRFPLHSLVCILFLKTRFAPYRGWTPTPTCACPHGQELHRRAIQQLGIGLEVVIQRRPPRGTERESPPVGRAR